MAFDKIQHLFLCINLLIEINSPCSLYGSLISYLYSKFPVALETSPKPWLLVVALYSSVFLLTLFLGTSSWILHPSLWQKISQTRLPLCDTSCPCVSCLLPCTLTIRSDLFSTGTCPNQSQLFCALGTSQGLVPKPWPHCSGLTATAFVVGPCGWWLSLADLKSLLLWLVVIMKEGD